jgi:hypothetical protein
MPASPVTDFRESDVALPRISINSLAPVGGERAVNTLAVKVIVSRFPASPAPGDQRL